MQSEYSGFFRLELNSDCMLHVGVCWCSHELFMAVEYNLIVAFLFQNAP